MELKLIDNVHLNNKHLNFLSRYCYGVTRDPDVELYCLLDNGLKTIMVLKSDGIDLSTHKELNIGTIPNERKKGYATIAVKEIMNILINRPDIQTIRIYAINPITKKIMNKVNCIKTNDDNFIIKNPYYDKRYKELLNELQEGKLSLKNISFILKSNRNIKVLFKRWYQAYLLRRALKKIEEKEKVYEKIKRNR